MIRFFHFLPPKVQEITSEFCGSLGLYIVKPIFFEWSLKGCLKTVQCDRDMDHVINIISFQQAVYISRYVGRNLFLKQYLDKKIIEYVKQGDAKKTKLIIKCGGSVQANEKGFPLKDASKFGHSNVTRILLDHSADLHAYDECALKFAAIGGYLDVVGLLVRRGANIHAQENFAFRAAASYGHLEVLVFLFNEGVNNYMCGNISLITSARNGHIEIVRFLLNKGANIHSIDDLALRSASMNGHLNIVRVLVSRGANIHAKNDDALVSAMLNGWIEIVYYLIDNGANIHAQHEFILRSALQNHNTDLIQVLLDCEGISPQTIPFRKLYQTSPHIQATILSHRSIRLVDKILIYFHLGVLKFVSKEN